MLYSQTLIDLYNSLDNIELFDWLDGLSYSQAFVVSIGAGPWKIKRREKIQGEALKWLDNRDLFDVKETVNCFPLDWQNKMTQNLISSLQKSYQWHMEKFCSTLRLQDHNYARKTFYNACGSNGTKVLSLFCRDALKIDSFPIDRHVRRILQENNLPIKEEKMISICKASGLDPRKVATALAKINVENPSWNKKEI